MSSESSRLPSRSKSGSDVYQDVHGCYNEQHVCSACSQNAIRSDKVGKKSDYYETLKFLLNQLARGDTDLQRNADEDCEQEPLSHYYHGGYHVLRLGDWLNQRKYFIIRKLGWDELSTQWLARDIDNKRYVSVNIYKSSEMHTNYATNLIKTLIEIQKHPSDKLMKLLDHFQVTGINGTHVCTVTEIMAECLCNYMIRQKFQPAPLVVAKIIVNQILEGLNHLHTKHNLVHTSIKPESIFFKADHVYIMTLVYETYIAFNNPILPNSFTCNLPDRLVHFRTNISDVYPHIQTKMLLLDKEFEQFVNREENFRLNDYDIKQVLDLQKWLTDGKNENQGGTSHTGEISENANTLMKRLSRYIKSKINIQQATTHEECHDQQSSSKTKSKSCSTCKSSIGSNYKSSNTTNYESTSFNFSTSSSSSSSGMSSGESSDTENEVKKLNQINRDEVVTQVGICCIEEENPFTKMGKVTEKDCDEYREETTSLIVETPNEQEPGQEENETPKIEEMESDSDSKENSNLVNTQIEQKETNNYNDTCTPDLDDEERQIHELEENASFKLLQNSEFESDDEVDIQISPDEMDDISKETDEEARVEIDSKSDFVDNSEEDRGDVHTSPSKSRCESNGEHVCRCYHCQNMDQSCHEKEEAPTQGDSSYSTSTSTQESYSEFLLSYCKHNTLCKTFSKYVKQISQFVYMNEELLYPTQNIEIVITDLEYVRPENDETICREDIHRQYKAVELIYTKEFDMKIDIWSTACLTFELVTGDYMFNPFESKYYTIDEHHILKIIQLMAEIPPNLMDNERCIRNIKVLLERDQHNITSMNAKDNFYRILAKSYKIPKEDAKQLVRFLIPMLRLNPNKRETAEQCLQNEWLIK